MNGEADKTVERDIPKSLDRLITSLAKDEGFDDYKIVINQINTGGGNYMGDLYAIDILQAGKETLNVFAKASNAPEHVRAYIPAREMYGREVFAYTELANAFDDLQNEHSVPEDQRFKFARYYASDMTPLEEVIVLENLASRGYGMYERCRSLDWECAAAALEQLARFHALSFALEIERPKLHERLVRSRKDFLVNREQTGSEYRAYRDEMVRMALEALEPRYVAAVGKFCEGLDEFWPRQYRPLTRQSVLVHGDYRISNQMVKYEEGTLTSLVALDYQTVFYGSPINDLLYLLVTGTDEEFRRRHYEDYVQHYHDALARALARLSHRIDDVYPRSLFYKHLNDKLLYGLGVAIFLLPIVVVEANAAPKLSDIVEGGPAKSIPGSAIYGERLNGIVADLQRWGALDALQ